MFLKYASYFDDDMSSTKVSNRDMMKEQPFTIMHSYAKLTKKILNPHLYLLF